MRMVHELSPEDRLLTPGEVSALFGVTGRTIVRWAKKGILTALYTPGGHRRYRETEARGLLKVLSMIDGSASNAEKEAAFAALGNLAAGATEDKEQLSA
jgi:excisionase family DNA binding protein